ncbi:hypothetical protein SNEBB_005756 [Seison nebaliae]|nr:hypothetical protein SNEBB_005756 [Seison nebaliae]
MSLIEIFRTHHIINQFPKNYYTYELKDLLFLEIIHSGSFGYEFLAFSIKRKEFYRIKIANVVPYFLNIFRKEATNRMEETFLHLHELYRREKYMLLMSQHSRFLVHGLFVITYQSYIYFAYELCNGEIIFVLVCCCHGLSYLHKNNILHRNIKPQNIYISRNGYLKLGGYELIGLQRQPNHEYKATRFGTSGFIAPEMMSLNSNKFQDETVDIYALGVTIFQCLTGYQIRWNVVSRIFDATSLQLQTDMADHVRLPKKLFDNVNLLDIKYFISTYIFPLICEKKDRVENVQQILRIGQIEKIYPFAMVHNHSLLSPQIFRIGIHQQSLNIKDFQYHFTPTNVNCETFNTRPRVRKNLIRSEVTKFNEVI